MDLIIGTRHITPDAITRTPEGVEAVLHGEALMSLLQNPGISFESGNA